MVDVRSWLLRQSQPMALPFVSQRKSHCTYKALQQTHLRKEQLLTGELANSIFAHSLEC